jgi:hypothetical protein
MTDVTPITANLGTLTFVDNADENDVNDDTSALFLNARIAQNAVRQMRASQKTPTLSNCELPLQQRCMRDACGMTLAADTRHYSNK